MNLKTIINIIPLVGVLVMMLWGFFGNAWSISWISSFVGVMLMCIFNVIAKGDEKNKKNNDK